MIRGGIRLTKTLLQQRKLGQGLTKGLAGHQNFPSENSARHFYFMIMILLKNQLKERTDRTFGTKVC
jgi:hypothetical protein